MHLQDRQSHMRKYTGHLSANWKLKNPVKDLELTAVSMRVYIWLMGLHRKLRSLRRKPGDDIQHAAEDENSSEETEADEPPRQVEP